MGSCQSAAVVMWSIITVLCVVMCCWNTVSARPKEEDVEEDVSLAETKDPETNPLEDLLAELRDSTVFPVLLNPFQITKLTCGSLLTFYDTGATDAAVSVDLCLTALIVAKLVEIVPIIISDLPILRVQGGVLGLVDRIWEGIITLKLAWDTSRNGDLDKAVQGGVLGLVDRIWEGIVTLKQAWDTSRNDALDKTGTGQDQEAHMKSLDVSEEEDTFLDQGDNYHNSPDMLEYFGFGHNGWKSETAEAFFYFADNSLSRRGFPS